MSHRSPGGVALRMAGRIVFAGDPHGNFSPILRACAAMDPGTLVLVGDCDCAVPLPTILAPLFSAGWVVRWILGNHDTETEALYDNLVGSHPSGDFGLQAIEVGGVTLAGLPGVFKPRVWLPIPDEATGRVEAARFQTREAFKQSIGQGALWRGDMPLWHRDTIFPEDFDTLGTLRFDILVSHEAPSSHPHGSAVIDDLAASCGARLIVHGHHHQSYEATLPNGIAVRGLGVAEPWVLPDRWQV
jgi:hypothetical protein